MSEVEYAGFWRRLLSFLIDLLILWVPASAFRWSASYFDIAGITLELIDFSYVSFVWALYYGLMESSQFQATLGKRVLRLKVTSYSGDRISFWNAVGRFLGQIIAVLPLGIGIFMIGWTKRKQGIHDMLANCLVIRDEPVNP